MAMNPSAVMKLNENKTTSKETIPRKKYCISGQPPGILNGCEFYTKQNYLKTWYWLTPPSPNFELQNYVYHPIFLTFVCIVVS